MARNKKTSASSVADWRNIADDREKYAAYLCSREWSVKKEAVKQRCGGICERCKALPVDHVHHLTYARKYHEELEDLQGRCKPCHEFEHGKDDFDPKRFDYLLRWLGTPNDRPPMPMELFLNLIDESYMTIEIEQSLRGVKMLYAAGFLEACNALETTLPFRLIKSWIISHVPLWEPENIAKCYRLTGHTTEPKEWFDLSRNESAD